MERDEEPGLQLHGVRYYVAWLGRWISADSIRLGGGINTFAYVQGRTTTLADSSGHLGALVAGAAALLPEGGALGLFLTTGAPLAIVGTIGAYDTAKVSSIVTAGYRAEQGKYQAGDLPDDFRLPDELSSPVTSRPIPEERGPLIYVSPGPTPAQIGDSTTSFPAGAPTTTTATTGRSSDPIPVAVTTPPSTRPEPAPTFNAMKKADNPTTQKVADAVDAAFPGHVVTVEMDVFVDKQDPVLKADNRVTDVDVVLKNALIQVKRGSGSGLEKQLEDTQAAFPHMPVVGYVEPTTKTKWAAIEGARAKGWLVATDLQELVDLVAPDDYYCKPPDKP